MGNTNPGHTRRLPTGTDLAGVLRRLFARQKQEAVASVLRTGRLPDMSGWLPIMADAVRPHLLRYWQHGAEDAHRRLARRLNRKPRKSPRRWWTKDKPTGGFFEFAFDLFNPRILQAVDRAVMDFCQATLETAIRGAMLAIEQTRQHLRAGLEAGETYRELSKRVGEAFADPMRANRIARTEATRAVHGGQVLLAQESGVVVGLKWLASSDACDLCLSLNGKVIPLGGSFHTHDSGNPAYRDVPYPPAHPHCMCSCTEELGIPQAEAATDEFGVIPFPPYRVGEPRTVSLPPRMAASWRQYGGH